jgi:hypothetical protein
MFIMHQNSSFFVGCSFGVGHSQNAGREFLIPLCALSSLLPFDSRSFGSWRGRVQDLFTNSWGFTQSQPLISDVAVGHPIGLARSILGFSDDCSSISHLAGL